MMKIAICEDNPVQLEKLQNSMNIQLGIPYQIDSYTSAEEFRTACADNNAIYDLVFMDIDLGDEADNGIALASDINKMSGHTQIIYISEHLEYISDAYETEHIYFLNKSRMDEYLPRALRIAMNKLDAQDSQYLHFQKRRRNFSVLQSDILYMERSLRETTIHTTTETYTTTASLIKLMEQLSPSFVLCHRSFLVNLREVYTLERDELTLYTGQVIPVGRTYYQQLKKAFARMILEQ